MVHGGTILELCSEFHLPFKMAAVTKNKISSVVHCCFILSQNEVKLKP
jgi:hypothetical protein